MTTREKIQKRRSSGEHLEEAADILFEAQAIIAFLADATDSFAENEGRFCDDIHKDSNCGLHLCFESALERLAQVRELIHSEKGGKAAI